MDEIETHKPNGNDDGASPPLLFFSFTQRNSNSLVCKWWLNLLGHLVSSLKNNNHKKSSISNPIYENQKQ